VAAWPEYAIAVGHLRGPQTGLSLASALNAELDQCVADGGPRGKRFPGNLRYGAAFCDVFLVEEILVFPMGRVIKINGVNEMRDRCVGRGNISSRRP
jgi:hypothetical protein